MDGVTDAAFRKIVALSGKSSVSLTEFVNVEGLSRGAVSMLDAFIYSEEERPAIAQIYGVEVESFYKVTIAALELGYDGIDINMGCPANKIARRGSGAGLINTPELAKEIVSKVKQASLDWSNGITMEEAELRPKLINAVRERQRKTPQRKLAPVSVKTRIGVSEDIGTEWMRHLVEARPANISVHGRTLKQGYSGFANWDTIGKCAEIVKKEEISFLGNGDIKTLEDAHQKIQQYKLDGVLIGRALFGKPWFFSGKQYSQKQALETAILHGEIFKEILPDRAFFAIRKHLAWYCKEFEGASQVRMQLMQVNSPEEIRAILEPIIRELD